jgi:hypothetical protein
MRQPRNPSALMQTGAGGISKKVAGVSQQQW